MMRVNTVRIVSVNFVEGHLQRLDMNKMECVECVGKMQEIWYIVRRNFKKKMLENYAQKQ